MTSIEMSDEYLIYTSLPRESHTEYFTSLHCANATYFFISSLDTCWNSSISFKSEISWSWSETESVRRSWKSVSMKDET